MKSLNISLCAAIFVGNVLTGLSLTNPQPVLAQKQTCVITEDGNTVCGKPTPKNKKQVQPLVQRRNVKNYTLSLQGCKRQDLEVSCSLTVINTGAEKRFSISPVNSSFVDAKGRAYKGNKISIGGKTDVYSLITISPGVEYTAELIFENIPEQISGMPIMNIHTNAGKVQFRNIPL